MKEISIHKRYRVSRNGQDIKSFHSKILAVRYARYRQSLGFFEYTVKDSKH